MDFLVGIIPFIFIISVIVTIHEYGHYGVARLFKTRVDRFSIGFGKVLWSRKDKDGVEWAISALPLGGYVKFSGDDSITSMIPSKEELEQARANITEKEGAAAVSDYYHFKPLYQRFLIVLAGPMANFVLAVFAFMIIGLATPRVIYPPIIIEIESGSAAAMAGMKAGDIIQKVDGKPVTGSDEVSIMVKLRADTPVVFEIKRGQEILNLTASVRREVMIENNPSGRLKEGRLGIRMGGKPTIKNQNILEAFGYGIHRTTQSLETNLTYISRIFVGKEDGSQMSGILGMTKATGTITQNISNSDVSLSQKAWYGFIIYLHLAALISVGVGFINLVPIPPLDGGHLAFYAYQGLTGQSIDVGVQNAVFKVAIVLVFGLMIFAFWNDVHNTGLVKFFEGLFS
jgi:regulator of sigma E protease